MNNQIESEIEESEIEESILSLMNKYHLSLEDMEMMIHSLMDKEEFVNQDGESI